MYVVTTRVYLHIQQAKNGSIMAMTSLRVCCAYVLQLGVFQWTFKATFSDSALAVRYRNSVLCNGFLLTTKEYLKEGEHKWLSQNVDPDQEHQYACREAQIK